MMAVLRPIGMWWFCYLTLLVITFTVQSNELPARSTSRSPSDVQAGTGFFRARRWVQKANCGDNMCSCKASTAHCSEYQGKLTYIPRLPKGVTAVDLSRNNLSSKFFTRNTFANLTKIRNLFLSDNNISWLPVGVFKEMKVLTSLFLDGNKALNLSSLRESILSAKTLESLSAENCNLSPPPLDLFQNNSSPIRTIRLGSNSHGGVYNLEGFCALQFLRNLDLHDCDFKDITSSCLLHELSVLDLTGNALEGFPNTCMRKESIYPRLAKLFIARNRIKVLSTVEVCLPSLMELDMSNNLIQKYSTGTFSSVKFPRLQSLNLKRQSINWDIFTTTTRIEAYAFDNLNLTWLDLAENELDFNDKSTSNYVFANCNNITTLVLDSNSFLGVDDQRFLLLLGHLQSLEKLLLRNNKLESISRKTFVNFPKLSHLFLHDNIIDNVPDGTFDSLQRLQVLFLHNNKINTINENTFGKNLRGRLSWLTLAFNPFVCSCDIMWFQHWLLTEPFDLTIKVGANDARDYKCQNIPGATVANFSISEQACLLSREVNVFIIQSCSAVILALTLFSLVFRYRWHLRLLMYEVFRGRDVRRRQRLMNNDFDYDVFVSYASEDLPWVREQLMARLEGELGLRLCVHERDFIPGKHIVDNIVQCVESSKKILMVFSRHFLRSQWCQFELSLCLSHVMDYDDALIVVCVDDVTSRQMTSAMAAVLKTTTYIQWRQGDDDAVASFWGRLHLALHEVMRNNEQYV